MTATACPACGGAMNAVAAVCPHCGHRVAPATGIAGAKLTTAEARALLLLHHPEGSGASRSLASFVPPHRSLGGAARSADLALGVVTAPLWSLGLLGAMLTPGSWRRRAVVGGEATVALFLAVTGLSLLWMVAGWVVPGATLAVVVVELGAWAARTAIRMPAEARTSRALSQLDAPPTAPTTTAPTTTVPTTTAPAALPPASATERAAPADVEPASLTDGPRRLR